MTLPPFRPVLLLLAALQLTAAAGCSKPDSSGAGSVVAEEQSTVSLDKSTYAVLPDADRDADPSVSADLGGRGFTGAGWQTSSTFDLIGDPRARKGGAMRRHLLDFPATLRMRGPESNTEFNDLMQPLVYETLLMLHPTSLQWVPMLATHWQISPDGRTFRFRLNPNARFSNGDPVTADDVVATWRFVTDRGLQDPSARLAFTEVDEPIKESRYIVRMTTRSPSWRTFHAVAGTMYILPARTLATLTPQQYLTEYNLKLLPGSGPYAVNDGDVVSGQRITIRRRSDYWADSHRRNIGRFNFDEIQAIVIRDPLLAIETFKRGDIDILAVNSARQWAQQLDFDGARRGAVQKRRIYNAAPTGIQGIAFNTRRQPWNDKRVREALALLLNRDLLIEKLFFNDYVPQNSYFSGGLYENPSNPPMRYEPARAAALLAEAGWTNRDAQGRLVKDGKPLTIEVAYGQKTSEAFLTVYQEELRRAGVTLTLRLTTPEALFQMVMQRRFETALMAWSGDLFPDPALMLDSRLASELNTNNITGFSNTRVDELLKAYEAEFDQDKRAAIVREIDGIAAAEHHYILQWHAPFRRLAYWNRFGQPPGYLTRTGTQGDAASLWWSDPARESRAVPAGAQQGAPGAVLDVHYWDGHAR